MKIKTYLACAAITLTSVPAHAIDLGTHKGVKLDLTLQINRALMHADNGANSDTFFVDNDNSSTRLNFKAQSQFNDSINVGGQFEAEYQSNASNLVDFDNKSSEAELDERKMEAWIASEAFGTLTIGQGSGAADGNMELDLSGTNVINWANPALLGGSIRFNDTGPKISSTMSNLDFESRYDRLRYDSPDLGPFSIAFSQGTKGNSDVTELGVRLNKKFDSGFQVRGALGYSNESTASSSATGDEETLGGSMAIKFANGFTTAVAIGQSQDDNPANPDSSFQSIKIGYKSGEHAISLLYAKADDRALAGDSSKAIGVGYVYSPEKWAELYAGYKVHSLDRSGTNFDDIHIATTGIRLKF